MDDSTRLLFAFISFLGTISGVSLMAWGMYQTKKLNDAVIVNLIDHAETLNKAIEMLDVNNYVPALHNLNPGLAKLREERR